MPSEKSLIIRKSLHKPDQPDTRPYPIQRKEWEDAVRDVPLPTGTTIEKRQIDHIYCELIQCDIVDASTLIVYLHGGGFVVGSCMTHRLQVAQLSQACGIPVLSVNYRLAPEHRFPTGLDDVVNVYRHLIETTYHPSQIIFAGDSAGGGLVASAMLKLRNNHIALPKAGILISPWLDLTLTGDSIQSQRDNDPMIIESDLRYTASHYVDDALLSDPLVSPVYASLEQLPLLLIHVGEHEILQSDAVRFAEKAQTGGINVQLKVWDSMWHVFHAHAPDLPEAQQALDEIAEFVKSL